MANKKYAVGVDLGGSTVKFGLVSSDGKIHKKFSLDSMADQGPDVVIEQIKKGITKLLSIQNKVAGIGIGAPGSVLIKKGTVENPPNMKNWESIPLGDIIRKEFKKKVLVENDANAAAIGEMIFGAGKKLENFVMITLGTGVGGGIIINRKIYRGETGAAGEIGHLSINERGKRCNCGSRGCIETYVGRKYIADQVKKELPHHKNSKIYKLVEQGNEITPKLIHDAYMQDDAFAEVVIVDLGQKIGSALASISNILDISKFIVGGGVAGFGKILYETIEDTMKRRVVKPKRSYIKVLPAKLKNDAGIKGASAIVFTGS